MRVLLTIFQITQTTVIFMKINCERVEIYNRLRAFGTPACA